MRNCAGLSVPSLTCAARGDRPGEALAFSRGEEHTDLSNANVVYLMVTGKSLLYLVEREEVNESYLCRSDTLCSTQCVLPSWLGLSRIPSPGSDSLV
jgi:hypothetical protein